MNFVCNKKYTPKSLAVRSPENISAPNTQAIIEGLFWDCCANSYQNKEI